MGTKSIKSVGNERPLLKDLPGFATRIENNQTLLNEITTILQDNSDYSYTMEQTVLVEGYFNCSAEEILEKLIEFVNENYQLKK